MRMAPVDEDRPLAHVRKNTPKAPVATPVDVPVPPPAPVADEAGIGAFAAAVAAEAGEDEEDQGGPRGHDARGGRGPRCRRGPRPARSPRLPLPGRSPRSPPRASSARKISYRQVRISSEPDVVQSVELGRLDRGDEVEILESYQGYLRVRTPGRHHRLDRPAHAIA